VGDVESAQPCQSAQEVQRQGILTRERLEHRFFVRASKSGKPRGLEWVDCEFEDDVAIARDRHTGRLRAVVGVTFRFRAIEGGGMENNSKVANLKAASATFFL